MRSSSLNPGSLCSTPGRQLAAASFEQVFERRMTEQALLVAWSHYWQIIYRNMVVDHPVNLINVTIRKLKSTQDGFGHFCTNRVVTMEPNTPVGRAGHYYCLTFAVSRSAYQPLLYVDFFRFCRGCNRHCHLEYVIGKSGLGFICISPVRQGDTT